MTRAWPAARRGARRPADNKGTWRRVLDCLLAAAILGLLALIAARLDRVETRRQTGAAVVNDGDTVTLNGERIRLRGMDAPELSQTCRKDGEQYPCGKLSRDALRTLIAGQVVTCSGWERDRYGRLLGLCQAGKTDLNSAQVEGGWAVAYGDYEVEQARARAKGKGLWAGSFDRPREWRERQGTLVDPEHDGLGSVLN